MFIFPSPRKISVGGRLSFPRCQYGYCQGICVPVCISSSTMWPAKTEIGTELAHHRLTVIAMASTSCTQSCHSHKIATNQGENAAKEPISPSDPTEPCGPAGLARTYQPTHTLFSRPGLSQRMSLGVQFKYGSKALFGSQTVKIFQTV